MTEYVETFDGQKVVEQSFDGRILTMDSLTFVGARNYSSDVIVSGSFIGAMPIRYWVGRVQPKGVIGHAAGCGRNLAGISGLWALEAMDIPAAAAETFSCRISDGDDVYENGTVGFVNCVARDLGVLKGMPVKDAARVMLLRRRPLPEPIPEFKVLAQSKGAKIVAMVSVSFIDETNNGDVICAGSHFGRASAEYSSRFKLRGVLCNDAGRCKDDSGTSGLNLLNELGIPGAAVSAESAEIGDGVSTYEDGIISVLNDAARQLGVATGMAAAHAAKLMLEGPFTGD